MPRPLLAAALLLAAVLPLPAADPVAKPNGNWKLRFDDGGQPIVFTLRFVTFGSAGSWALAAM